MKDALVPIDGAGRVVLPKNVRDELAIKPGDLFKVSVHGASIELMPNKTPTGLVRKGRALVFSTADLTTISSDAVNALLDQGREERDNRTESGGAARKRSK